MQFNLNRLTALTYIIYIYILTRCVLCVEADGVTGEGPLPEISERSQAVRRTSVQVDAGRKCKDKRNGLASGQ